MVGELGDYGQKRAQLEVSKKGYNGWLLKESGSRKSEHSYDRQVLAKLLSSSRKREKTRSGLHRRLGDLLLTSRRRNDY